MFVSFGFLARPASGQLTRLQLVKLCFCHSKPPTAPTTATATAPTATTTAPLTAFATLGLGAQIQTAMREMNITKPSNVQAISIPRLLKGESLYVAAPTGTGKTLTYLLPIMQRMRKAEENGEAVRAAKRPRCIVVVPSRELAKQVFSITKSISHHLPCRSILVVGGEEGHRKVQRSSLSQPVDIVVSTPGRLLQLIEKGEIYLSQLNHVVVDEADTLLSTSPGNAFGDEVRNFLTKVMNGDLNPQICLTSATFPPLMQKYVQKNFPSISPITARDLHTKLRRVGHKFVRVFSAEDKHSELLHILRSQTDGSVMVFCNTVTCCRSTEHFLKEQAFSTACYHGEMPASLRSENFDRFVEGKAKILVCTDIASRGLDTPFVDHVVMFDFPLNTVDFIHRAGRTGRLASKPNCSVTCLVAKRDLILANKIQEATASQDISSLTSDRVATMSSTATSTTKRTATAKTHSYSSSASSSSYKPSSSTAFQSNSTTRTSTSRRSSSDAADGTNKTRQTSFSAKNSSRSRAGPEAKKKRSLRRLKSGPRKAPLLGEW